MKKKFLRPEMDIIKLLTDDVVCTSGTDYTNDGLWDEADGNGGNIGDVGELS